MQCSGLGGHLDECKKVGSFTFKSQKYFAIFVNVRIKLPLLIVMKLIGLEGGV